MLAKEHQLRSCNGHTARSAKIVNRTHLIYTFIITCILCELLFPAVALGSGPVVSTKKGTAEASIILTWPDIVEVTQIIDGHEILLRFDQPLGDLSVDVIQRSLPNWVNSVQYGYNSLLIRAIPEVDFSMQNQDGRVEVVMQSVVPVNTYDISKSSNHSFRTENRLQCLRAMALLASNDYDYAQRLLTDLLQQDPENIDALLLMAETEERLGRWRDALEYYNNALRINNNQPEVSRARSRLLQEHGNSIQGRSQILKVDDAEQQSISSLEGRLVSNARLTVNIAAQIRDITIDNVQRINGQFESFAGVRTYGKLTAKWEWTNFKQSKLDAFLNPYSMGMGISNSFGKPLATTCVTINYHEPYLSYLEGIIDGGTRDCLAISHRRRLLNRWAFLIEMSGKSRTAY